MRVIGLTGSKGAGKDTVARRLVAEHRFLQLSFADPLYDMLAAMLVISREELNQRMHDRTWKEAEIPELGASPRRLLQTLGTEWGRNLVGGDLWVRLLERRIAFAEEALSHEYDACVISDVRFENEAAFARRRGLLVHIDRPEHAVSDAHVSEAGVRVHHRDQFIVNLDFDALHRQVDRLAHEFLGGLLK